ncbi:Uncharacterised protein [Klebsiella oxytoca]|nr:Uncharacterised protein [Klebsiella oxytoca]
MVRQKCSGIRRSYLVHQDSSKQIQRQPHNFWLFFIWVNPNTGIEASTRRYQMMKLIVHSILIASAL